LSEAPGRQRLRREAARRQHPPRTNLLVSARATTAACVARFLRRAWVGLRTVFSDGRSRQYAPAILPNRRPKSWDNWREKDAAASLRFIFEHELYSDSVMHGVARVFGPYELVNLIAGDRKFETCRPVLALRVGYHMSAQIEDADLRLRGGTAEEVASLVALVLAIRLRAADYSRVFHFDQDGEDALGRPCTVARMTKPYLPHGPMTPVIARAERIADLDELELLDSYATIASAEQVTALVRAARLYQDALWVSERDPALAWLFLVSAVETAAASYFAGKSLSAVDTLREMRPMIAEACEKHGLDHLQVVANELATVSGAQKKFLGFIETFRPPPPTERPKEYRQEWDWKALKKSLRKVYELRSRALHAGDQIPIELCGTPLPYGGAPCERVRDFVGESRQPHGSHIIDEGFPMYLHVFEYIVQGSLVAWWRFLAPTPAPSTPASPAPIEGTSRGDGDLPPR